jgi:hypothetical protein
MLMITKIMFERLILLLKIFSLHSILQFRICKRRWLFLKCYREGPPWEGERAGDGQKIAKKCQVAMQLPPNLNSISTDKMIL